MENIFKGIKEKIKSYEDQLSKSNINQDKANIIKVEKDIEELKNKITELNKEIENKTKIERMKVSLNITSIESEISLKEMELAEEKKKAEILQQKEIKNYNDKLENNKQELITFIQNSELDIENAVKRDGTNIILNKDFEEIKGYYKNIINLEKKNLKNIYKEIQLLKDKITLNENEAKRIKEEADRYFHNGAYWGKQSPFTIGSFKKSENLHKKVASINQELEPQKKEMEKLNIKKEASKKKVENIELMVDEMIKELIKEEVDKNEIVFPSFALIGKYFNSSEGD